MSDPIIRIENLVKDYRDTRAVDHLDLEIEKGEIYGLLGPNGAGKTTVILTLLGLTEPTAGRVTVKGYNATSEPIRVKTVTSYLPDEVGFSGSSTGLESLVYTAMLNRVPREEAIESAKELLDIVGLGAVGDQKTKTYSKGMIQRLGLADVLITEPEIIVLDEPTIGIDPKGINEFLDMIRSWSKEQGITVLLCSHLLHQVQKICDRVGILVEGQLLAEGDIHELADELFGDREASITAEVDPVTDSLIRELKQTESIRTVERDGETIRIRGKREAAPLISQTIVRNGGDLYRLSYKEYGLDEIYQYYFEGGGVKQ
ncbi:ABC-2 type transport system ATP-binding protein [Fodinibius roseus]|uniref:ABC-2 type transport system ATP-binding protein n=1 Tax=Fodinibius roseus TaxID=1194090 RepID=A0A1M4V1P0_9BACT|nr:ABC transporter ATP-binding protein [Fodinibius roseus]SHE62807.1 ABC-2 type transport system ATP-binding protein [Fodinibius roseus]